MLLLGSHQIARGAGIIAVRIWPAADYTRITIESDVALKTKQTFIKEPPRLAVDIEGLELNPALRELVAKVKSDDPFISGIRVGQYTTATGQNLAALGFGSPNIVRLVLDLKQAALPQVFTLPPVAAYAHRLVLDLYPVTQIDPLEALINERMKESTKKFEAEKATATASGTTTADPLGDLIAQKNSKKAENSANSSTNITTNNIASQAINTPATSIKTPETETKPSPFTSAILPPCYPPQQN